MRRTSNVRYCHTVETSLGVLNPYTRAYRGELGSEGITNSQDGRKTDDRVNGHLVQHIKTAKYQDSKKNGLHVRLKFLNSLTAKSVLAREKLVATYSIST